jgi:hypothetical protein
MLEYIRELVTTPGRTLISLHDFIEVVRGLETLNHCTPLHSKWTVLKSSIEVLISIIMSVGICITLDVVEQVKSRATMLICESGLHQALDTLALP